MHLSTIHAVCLFTLLLAATIVASPGNLHAQEAPADGARPRPVVLQSCIIRVDVVGRIATTTIEQTYHNTSGRNHEVVMRFILPPTAAVRGLAMWIAGVRQEGVIHPRLSAKRIYRQIRDANRDPAVLENLGAGRWQLSVFPVLPKSSQKIQISYSEFLPAMNGHVAYKGPGVAKTSTLSVARTLEFSANVRCAGGIKDVSAPLESMKVTRKDGGTVVADLRSKNADLTKTITFTFAPSAPVSPVAAHREAGNKGYFVTVLDPFKALAAGPAPSRDVVIVLDVSGSMRGRRLDYAMRSTLEELKALRPGDRLAMVAAGPDVALWRKKLAPVTSDSLLSARDWMVLLHAGGGADVAGALRAAESFNTDPKRPFHLIVFSDGGDMVGIGGSGKAAGPVATNVQLYTRDVSSDGKALDAFRKLSGLPEGHHRGERFNPDKPTVTNLRIEPVGGKGTAGASELAHTAIEVGRPIILAGRWQGGGKFSVRISATINGKTVSSERTIALGDVPDSGAWSRQASRDVRQVWAHLRAEGLFGDIYRRGASLDALSGLIAHSRSHHVATRVTAMLVLENDRDYERRGISRPPRTVNEGQKTPALDVSGLTLTRQADDTVDPTIAWWVTAERGRARSLRKAGRYAQASAVLDSIVRRCPGQYATAEEAALLREYAALSELVGTRDETASSGGASKPAWQELLLPNWGPHVLGGIFLPVEVPPKVPTVAPPAPDEANAHLRHVMSQRLPKVKFKNIPLELVAQYLHEISGIGIRVNWEALQVASVEKSTEVSIDAANRSLASMLNEILEQCSGSNVGSPTQLAYRLSNGGIVVTTREAFSHMTSTKIYDVRDIVMHTLIHDRLSYRAAALPLQSARYGLRGMSGRGGGGGRGSRGGSRGGGPIGGGGPARVGGGTIVVQGTPTGPASDWAIPRDGSDGIGGGFIGGGSRLGGGDDDWVEFKTKEEMLTELTDLIKETVMRDTWEQDAAIRPMAGQLVVTQDPDGHEALLDLLTKLRVAMRLVAKDNDKLARIVAQRRATASMEGLTTYDGYVTKWVLDLLAKVRGGKLSTFSSVKVAKVGGRLFARIGGTWFDASVTGRMQVAAMKRDGAAAAMARKIRPELKGMMVLEPSVLIALDDERAVCFSPVGLDRIDASIVGQLIPAASK